MEISGLRLAARRPHRRRGGSAASLVRSMLLASPSTTTRTTTTSSTIRRVLSPPVPRLKFARHVPRASQPRSSPQSPPSEIEKEREEGHEDDRVHHFHRREETLTSSSSTSSSSSSTSSPPPPPSPFAALSTSPYDSDIAELALPTVVALAADPLLSLVDTAFAGALGAAPLAALGVNSALFTFCFFSFNFLSSASTPLVAAADGAGDTARVGRVAAEAGVLALVLGTAVALLLSSFSEPVLSLMGAPPPELDPDGMTSFAEQYLRWRAGAAPAALLMTVGAGVLRGIGDVGTPLRVTLGCNAVHLLLAPLLVFGSLGPLELPFDLPTAGPASRVSSPPPAAVSSPPSSSFLLGGRGSRGGDAMAAAAVSSAATRAFSFSPPAAAPPLSSSPPPNLSARAGTTGGGMGVSGAAAATFVAEWGAALAYLYAAWRQRTRLGLSPFPRFSAATARDDFGPFLTAGGAVLARTSLLLGTKTLAASAAARAGVVPAAAHQVLMQLWLLASFAIDSLAVAGQALVARAVGASDKRRARGVAERLLVLGIGSGALLAALLLMLGEPLLWPLLASGGVDGSGASGATAAASEDGARVVAAVAALAPLAMGVLPLNAAVYVLDGVLLGAGDFAFLAGAMAVAAGVSVAVLTAVGSGSAISSLPFPALSSSSSADVSGLGPVWAALVSLMACRLLSLAWRFQDGRGPVPPFPTRGDRDEEKR